MRKLSFIFLTIFIFVSAESYSQSSDSPILTKVVQVSYDRNYYDLQSNGSPQLIWQDPAHPSTLYTVYTTSSQLTGWNDRSVKYFYTTDGGDNWSIAESVTSGEVSDYPAITGLSSGAIIIALNKYTNGIAQTQIYQELFPQIGIFSNANPGGANNKYLWPRIAPTVNGNPNQYVFLASSSFEDSSFYNIKLTNSFKGYKQLNAKAGESYAIGTSTSGLIGIAYVAGGNNSANYGDVFFMESSDNGNTFSVPLKIFDANFSGDSLGGFKGISITYQGTLPQVVFETVKQKTNGEYFPESPSKIRYWSTNLQGADPNRSIVIADTSKVTFAPAKGTLDFEAPLCRPSIGVSGKYIFCAFIAQSTTLGGSNNTSYNDIYLTYSTNNGVNWTNPSKIAGGGTVPYRYDFTAPSIVPNNYVSGAEPGGVTYYLNMTFQRDSIPGSNVNTNDAATNAKLFYYQRMFMYAAAPVLAAPPNNSTNNSVTPVFSWSGVGEYYVLQVSLQPDFSSILHVHYGDFNDGNTYQMPPGILQNETTYYWRVMSYSQGIEGQWSTIFNFRTGVSGINNITSEIPKEYKLYNNYPNPFNPTTKIKWDLPFSGFVKLKIYNAVGIEVESIVNEKQNAGSYAVDFNAASLPSGIYFYKLVTEKFSETKKMILIK
ncbi:MAG: T9SS type A sorting domain-containing protein [Bacteroidetes bacterium]|nr:T9SS type A sorting domain-containing protein [Bacteroidota bacterium]